MILIKAKQGVIYLD